MQVAGNENTNSFNRSSKLIPIDRSLFAKENGVCDSMHKVILKLQTLSSKLQKGENVDLMEAKALYVEAFSPDLVAKVSELDEVVSVKNAPKALSSDEFFAQIVTLLISGCSINFCEFDRSKNMTTFGFDMCVTKDILRLEIQLMAHLRDDKIESLTQLSISQQQCMTIGIGSNISSKAITLQQARPWYPTDAGRSNMAADNAISLEELFNRESHKMVAIFGVPAPFTGTCSLEHYPGYRELADEILESGCDEIICYSVSDPYAHHGWAQSLGNDDAKIRFLADPEGVFAKAVGLDANYDAVSLGARSIRFSMIVEKGGKVVSFRHVPEDEAKVDAKKLLEELKSPK